ncbi:transposase [Paenibacillus sp. Dod16]|uniref:transposase n=1 Tax=Paenibacillus sp. Dod16 TaxID=3416392 RepID=UPI003CEBB605
MVVFNFTRFIPALQWVARSGALWRDSPEHNGSWKSVYMQFRRWQQAGVFDFKSSSICQQSRILKADKQAIGRYQGRYNDQDSCDGRRFGVPSAPRAFSWKHT